jgi:ribonuclease D
MASGQALIERPMIRTDEELAALCEELRTAGRFGLDTEFLGERTYVPKLCLVQISTETFIVLVDTIAVRNLAPLWELVADPTIGKVLHAAREDLRLAYYGGGRLIPQNIFDTQVAAGFVGLPMYPLSYARLTEALMGVKLGKGETRSEWDRRPLTPDQVAYARDDVRYLLPIADRLTTVLTRLGRLEWLHEEMERFSTAGVYEPDPDLAYLRLRGPRSGFTRRPTALLRAVAAWREREAADRDVPARTLLRDEALSELALRPPRRLTDFARLRAFPVGEDVALGPDIIRALDEGRAVPEDQLPAPLVGGGDDETPLERAAGDLLYALGESLCLRRDLAPELVISKADALLLARGRAETPLLSGWRQAALGEELRRLATGEARALIQIDSSGPQVSLQPAATASTSAG